MLPALALLAAISSGQLFNQGAPGHQGPWGVYIALLPDGGGGNNTVPCPFNVTIPGNGAFTVGCNAELVDYEDAGVGAGGRVTTGQDGTGGFSVAALSWDQGVLCALFSGESYPDGGGFYGGLQCLDTGPTVGDLQYGGGAFHVDKPFCFQNGSCQTSAAGGGWLEDGGVTYSTDSRVVIGTGTQTSPATTATLEVRSGAANGPLIAAQDNNNRGVVIDQSSLLMRLYATSAASMCIMPDGASNNGVCAGPSDIQFTTDNTVITKYKTKNGGGWIGTTSNHDFYIGAHDEFGAIGMSAGGGITIYDNIAFNNHELTSIGAAATGGSAAQLNQVQSDLSVTGLTLPGVSPANNLVIGSATGASNLAYSYTRYRINLTCLVAGVGAGTTTISLKDFTATSTLVTATESCACTPGAVVSAVSTGSSTDSDQFNIALGASASTDCATYPLFIANADLTRK